MEYIYIHNLYVVLFFANRQVVPPKGAHTLNSFGEHEAEISSGVGAFPLSPLGGRSGPCHVVNKDTTSEQTLHLIYLFTRSLRQSMEVLKQQEGLFI